MANIVYIFIVICSVVASTSAAATNSSSTNSSSTPTNTTSTPTKEHTPSSKPAARTKPTLATTTAAKSSTTAKNTTFAKKTTTAKIVTTPKIVTITKETSTAILTTTPVPKLNCSTKQSCSECSKDYHCYWCGPAKQCLTYPSGRIIPKGCPKNDWYWKQCFIPGYILIIVVPIIVGLFLLTCGCCIYCKCCRTSNRGWKKEEERITAKRQERHIKAEERKSERKKTTDALRMKYGLLKSDDEEQLIS